MTSPESAAEGSPAADADKPDVCVSIMGQPPHPGRAAEYGGVPLEHHAAEAGQGVRDGPTEYSLPVVPESAATYSRKAPNLPMPPMPSAGYAYA